MNKNNTKKTTKKRKTITKKETPQEKLERKKAYDFYLKELKNEQKN